MLSVTRKAIDQCWSVLTMNAAFRLRRQAFSDTEVLFPGITINRSDYYKSDLFFILLLAWLGANGRIAWA
jgi:hypothetical protein